MRTHGLAPDAFDSLRTVVFASAQARRQHRIHAVMLVAGGLSCRAAARLLGDPPRTVEYWVSRYKLFNLKGLFELKRPGRRARLTPGQVASLRAVVAVAPAQGGAREWTGAELAAYVSRHLGVTLGLRQAQRLLFKIRPNLAEN